jgi:hypothetical protein
MNTSILFNKSFRFAALASVVALGAFGASNSFAADSATANSTADVITPIAIDSVNDLAFGRFVVNGAIGTVTIATDSSRTATEGVVLSSTGPTSSAATFEVTGGGSATYSIGLTNTTLTSTGGAAMPWDTISSLETSNSTTAADVTSGTLTTEGKQTIHLGGILSVGATQIAGTYEGTVTATVEYN